MPTDNSYTCARCGNTYEKNLTDEEANLEAIEKFGESIFELGDVVIICDDCWNETEKLLFDQLKT